MSRCVPALILLIVSLTLPLLADDGDLDPSFWSDGKVALDVSADAIFGGLASDIGGQLAVAYSYVPPTGGVEAAVWRNVGDSSLGDVCVVEPYPSGVRDTRVLDVAFDGFGRLLVLAKEDYVDPVVGGMDAWFVLAYSYPDCVLDASFGGDGIVTLYSWDLGGMKYYRRLQPLANGGVLVSGWGMFGELCRVHVIAVAADGGSSSTFCATTFPSEVYGRDAVMAPNGHVVAIALTDDFWVVDFLPDGSVAGVIDVAFDLPGGDFVDNPNSIAATEDGKIVVVGTAEGSDSGPYYTYAAVAMLHWDAQGNLVLDPSFSGDGKLSFTFGGRAYNELEDVVAQGDGRFLVAGTAKYFASAYTRGMAVARLLHDGSFDPDFVPSQPGWRIVDFDVAPPAHDRAYGVALQNGRVVLAGTVDITDGIDSVGVARLLNAYVFADGFEAPQAPGWLWVE
jgi:hypothetical protein